MDTHLLLYIFGCLVLIGFFTGIEIAFNSANKINLELKIKQGSFSGRVLGRFMEKPSAFIGAGLIAVYLLVVCFVLLLTNFTHHGLALLPSVYHSPFLDIVFNIFLAGSLLILFGEVLPRAFFQKKAESTLSLLAFPMLWIYRVFSPISNLFVSISSFFLKYLFNVRVKDKEFFTRVNMDLFVKNVLFGAATESQQVNAELFDNALDLLHTKVRHCMIPRKEIIGIPITASIEEVRKKLIETQLSKIVVYENNLDNIVGYVHHLDFNKKPLSTKDIMHSITAVPETMNVMSLINQFTKERKSIAWVVDEFGGTAGIVTMEDLLEELFGEIKDEYDEDVYVEKQIAENEFIFSGRLELSYLNSKYGFNLKADDVETLSGFIIRNQKRIPPYKARVIIGLYEFDILLVSDTRIETVKMKLLKPL